MARLTKKQKLQIGSAIDSLTRTIKMLENEKYQVCLAGEINAEVQQTSGEFREAMPYRSQDYTGRDDETWTIEYIRTLQVIDKTFGSDLVGIYTAKQTLETLLSYDG